MMDWVELINDFLWGNVLAWFLLIVGIYFTIRTRFVQVRRFRFSVKNMLRSRENAGEQSISSFQAFCTSLAARVGTGNLAGVAVAIHLGGPGAVFWMWIVALLGMSTSLIENTLAQLYKTNDKDGTFRGGPAYYIEKALDSRVGGIIFSISLIISFGYAFNSLQSNSMAMALAAYDLPSLGVGVTSACLAAMIFFGGIRSIAKFAEKVVPAMALFYLVIALTVVVINITVIPDVIALIVKSAFGFKTAAAGGVAYAMKSALEQGVKRGVFSNEAGMGSAPNAAATATPVPNHPVTQGLVGMLGVFADTIVICSATAAIILVSGAYNSGLSSIELTQHALSLEIGAWGKHFITIAILLFAFTTLITNYYYGETNLRFIFKDKAPLLIYRLTVMAIIVLGAIAPFSEIWSLADLSMGIMTLINMVSILLLSKHVFAVLADYEKQLDNGIKEPVFHRGSYPFLDKTIDNDVWVEGYNRQSKS